MQREYIANGRRVILVADPTRVAVRFREPAPFSMRASVTESSASLGAFRDRYEIPGEKFTILPVAEAEARGPGTLSSVVAGLDRAAEVERVAPVFRDGPNRSVATDRVIVGFFPGAADPRAVLQARGLEILEERENRFVVRLGATEDPFDVAAELFRLPGVRFAEPDFVTLGERLARPGGALAPRPTALPPEPQYVLRLTGATAAQELLAGYPGREAIRIAVLDEGVDTLHADLREAVVATFDAVDDDTYQEPLPHDSHGTACAGLAAAVSSSGIGVRGIGTGCSILAVRIAYSDPLDPRTWVSRNSWVTRAVDWAWRNGAAVVSNSWGGGPPSTDIADAFDRARSRGRDGRGCVVVAAAGNHGGAVSFPASLQGLLAVAATTPGDEPKTHESSDGEYWWGSCFGPEVAIAAPGVSHYTTDNTGVAGTDRRPAPDGDYLRNFNGTSSATPIVAGAAALVLAANPGLAEARVRAILCATTDKVGGVDYEGGRNDRMGFGRLNVERAVRRAMAEAEESQGLASQRGELEPSPRSAGTASHAGHGGPAAEGGGRIAAPAAE